MSIESFGKAGFNDHSDSVLYMMTRREINETYAELPVNFNIEGLKISERITGQPLSPEDTIVDIGSNNGRIIAEAALLSDSQARIVCIEPDSEAYDDYLLQPSHIRHRVSFVRATGESMPIEDDSVQGVTLHNVIFRAKDAHKMLAEAQRIVEPGGYIAISSNARGHAHYRHLFEQQVAKEVMRLSGVEFAIPAPPAAGNYIEDLPSLINSFDALTIRDELYVPQDTRAIITPGMRLADYLLSIKFSVANTAISRANRSVWRQVVETTVKPLIEAEFERTTAIGSSEPHFADSIHRGMFVVTKDR